MKKIWRKTVLAVMSALVLGVGLLGCRIGNTEILFTSKLSKNDVFRIGGKTCSLSAAKVILTNYQNIYGTAYGVKLWEHDFGDNSLEQYVKDMTLSQLAKIISMNLLAKQQGIRLTEEELDLIEKAAKSYYDSLSREEIEYMDVDRDCIEELYQQYGLANKVYKHLTSGVSDEISDDDARVMEAYQIFVTTGQKAEEVRKALDKGEDFLTLADTYNEGEQLKITFGRGDMPREVEEIAFYLDTGKVSEVIKTEAGFYFIKCINNYNKELTDANKLVLLEQRRQEAFDEVYEAFDATLSSELNEELWNSIRVQVNDEIKTGSFFEIYEKYCGW